MRSSLALLALFIALPVLCRARTPATDPYIWLEDVASPRAMERVSNHNTADLKVLEGDQRYPTPYDDALAIGGDGGGRLPGGSG